MTTVDFETLSNFAHTCRRGLESLAGKAGSRFQTFPMAACGDSAELVGRFLREEFGLEGFYVCGSRHKNMKPTQTHAWFDAGGYILDLTHDQEPGAGLVGWVFPLDNPWHRKFRTQDRREGFCMPKDWPMYPFEGYTAIQHALRDGR